MFDHLIPVKKPIEPKLFPRAEYEIVKMPKTALPIYDKSKETKPGDLTYDVQFEMGFDEVKKTLAKGTMETIPEINVIPSEIKLEQVVEEIHWAEQKLKGNNEWLMETKHVTAWIKLFLVYLERIGNTFPLVFLVM